MSISDSDIAFARELFADLPALTHRKMFGGICLYSDDTVFALASSDGRLYLKATGPLADRLRRDGAEQFHSMPYWSLPEDVLDEPDRACNLAQETLVMLRETAP
ncbi:MAG: TfoX/Sxy family protein [Pseudomonadota bacterium]